MLMDAEYLRKFAVAAMNITFEEFANDIYGWDVCKYNKEDNEPRFDYILTKYHMFQRNPLRYICELDNQHLKWASNMFNKKIGRI